MVSQILTAVRAEGRGVWQAFVAGHASALLAPEFWLARCRCFSPTRSRDRLSTARIIIAR